MLLSNSKIDYSSVCRMPTVKLSGQPQGTTINTMPTSTSLQDISSHHAQKFTRNNNTDQQLDNFSQPILSSKNSGGPLNTSQSDKRIFEHPEVTIIPSALDDEIQRRLLTIKTSTPSENILERDGGKSAPNILEHPDMRSPVVMQPQQLSSSLSSSSIIHNVCKQVSRTQSVDVYSTMARTPSPYHRVDFFLDDHEDSKRSTSRGSLIGDITENSEQEKSEELPSSTKKDSISEHPKLSSKPNITSLKEKKHDSW